MNLAELAEHSAQRMGERKEMIFEGQEVSNIQFLDYGRRLHRGFSELGLKKGDVVVMCMINDPKVYGVFQGVFRNGAVAVPAMFALTAPELRFIISDCKAKGVVTDPFGIERIREAVKDLDHVKWVGVLGGEDDPSQSVPEYSLETLLKSEPELSLPWISDHDLAMFLYTSGTTGKPKGVMLTHRSLLFSAQSAINAAGFAELDYTQITVSTLPLAHIFGVNLMTGGFLLPESQKESYMVQMAWFDADRFFGLIQEHRANTITVVPTMLALLLNSPNIKNYDLTSLMKVVSGGSALPIEHAQAFCKTAGIESISELYGLTESCGLATSSFSTGTYPPGSVGETFPQMEIAVFDDRDYPVSPGEKGEIVLRGPSIMKGYFNRPKATAEALLNGWLHTGDIGYLNEDGHLFISDRKKDMIIRGGENIYPCELEDAMYEYPAILEVAVLGKPDPVYGEEVVAFVVLKQNQSATAEEIIEFTKTKVSKFKVPATIHFVDSLPKSLIGKLLKRELRDQL